MKSIAEEYFSLKAEFEKISKKLAWHIYSVGINRYFDTDYMPSVEVIHHNEILFGIYPLQEKKKTYKKTQKSRFERRLSHIEQTIKRNRTAKFIRNKNACEFGCFCFRVKNEIHSRSPPQKIRFAPKSLM